MSNLFLKVDKDLFNKDLNPTQILIIAQIEEFMRNTGDCHITDAQFAEMFGVSAATISREIKKLCEKGLVQKKTKNIQHGKQRHLTLTSINLPIVKSNETSTTVNLLGAEEANCLVRNEQNDLIKDKRKDNRKDNGESLRYGESLRSSKEQTIMEIEVAQEPIKRKKERIGEFRF